MKNPKDTGKRLQEIRAELNLTGTALASLSGDQRTAVSKMESGDLPISRKMLDYLIIQQGYSYEWITRGTGPKKPFNPGISSQQEAYLIDRIKQLEALCEKMMSVFKGIKIK